MNSVQIYIHRHRLTGEPLPKNEYKDQCPDIPVDVELSCKYGEWEIESAKIADDVHQIGEDGNDLPEWLFSFGQEIDLTYGEEQDAIEKAIDQHICDTWEVTAI